MDCFGNIAHFPTAVSILDLAALGQGVRITVKPTRRRNVGGHAVGGGTM